MKSTLALLGLLAISPACIVTKSVVYDVDPEQSAQAFEALKSLAGKWHGTSTAGSQQFPVDVTYEVVSGGTVVMERMFPSSEHEMISMYHRDGGKLLMTHYCSQGNQPRMEMLFTKPAYDPASHHEQWIVFKFRDATNPSSPKELVMHDMRLCLIDKDHLESSWTAFVDAKSDHTANFTFQRVP
ncbi:MAG TPA: hypothetical protein VK843_20335 [Planctomycetota bacterium]|nr:hypothetical protein [Planctomycetota bacterium]